MKTAQGRQVTNGRPLLGKGKETGRGGAEFPAGWAGEGGRRLAAVPVPGEGSPLPSRPTAPLPSLRTHPSPSPPPPSGLASGEEGGSWSLSHLWP